MSESRGQLPGTEEGRGGQPRYPRILVFLALGAFALHVTGAFLGGYEGGGVASAMSWAGGC